MFFWGRRHTGDIFMGAFLLFSPYVSDQRMVATTFDARTGNTKTKEEVIG